MTVAQRTETGRVGWGAALMVMLAAGTASPLAWAQGSGAVPPGPTGGAAQPTTPLPTAPSGGEARFPHEVPVYAEVEEDPYTDAAPVGTQKGMTVRQQTPPKAQEVAPGTAVRVSDYLTIDLFVQDEDLANVLQMLSLQTQRNIVASRDVSARVTANLYGVTFYEALDAILHVNGYGYIEKGPFIYVHTLEELLKIEQAQRQIVSKMIQLNYLNANDAAEFVAPLLSERGTIKTNGDPGSFSLPTDAPTGNEEFALAATLVIFDYPEHIAEIEALLDQLDTRPQQVLVEATILQTQLNEANAFGVDFAFLNGLDFTDFFGFGGPLGIASSLNSGDVAPADNRGSGVVTNPGNTNGPSTLKLSILHDDIALFIRALDEVSDVTILSNPKILALNRQPARVLVGRKVGYLNTTSTETATTQTVEFLDTGTQLAFRPFVSKDGLIRMELRPRVSEGVIREASDATGAAVTIPDEITQELTTNVIVPDGSTVVLGGLFRESTNLTRRQVPILGDIPIIGTAFRGHDDSTDRQEIIFMIKPTIMNDQVLLEQGTRATEYTGNIRTGTRSGLLPWSRERQTAQLNMKADRLLAEGKTKEAEWALRRSLELSPVQPGAIRQQEQLLNKKERWPNRSVLEEVIRGEADGRTSMYLQQKAERDALAAAAKRANEEAERQQAADALASEPGFVEPEAMGSALTEGFESPFFGDEPMFAEPGFMGGFESANDLDNFDGEPGAGGVFLEPLDISDSSRSMNEPRGAGTASGASPAATSGWSEWILPSDLASQLNSGGSSGASRSGTTASSGSPSQGTDRTGEAFTPGIRRDTMMKAFQGPVSTGSGPATAQATGAAAKKASAQSVPVASKAFVDAMNDPWVFAQSVPNMPFGMFWTALTWMQLESAYPGPSDAITTVEPGDEGR